MIRVTFLGTAASTPTRERSLPAVAIEYSGSVYLFDCGEGTQRQMIVHSVNAHRARAVFISHLHGDHAIGLAGLVRTLSLNRRTEPLYIYIVKGQERRLRHLLEFDNLTPSYDIRIVPIGTGKVHKGKGFTISAFRLRHSIDTLGFVFKEDDRVKFLKERFANLGIKGEAFSELIKRKEMRINGRKIKLSEITTVVPGKRIVYATDSRPTGSTVKAAKDADLLIHEATYAAVHKDLAKERMHSSSDEAATIAKKAGAKRLFLTHISARYRDTKELLSDARKIFKNAEVAKDGTVIEI